MKSNTDSDVTSADAGLEPQISKISNLGRRVKTGAPQHERSTAVQNNQQSLLIDEAIPLEDDF